MSLRGLMEITGHVCWKYLEGFDEGPKQVPDSLKAIQQLHQAHHAEQAEECYRYAHIL